VQAQGKAIRTVEGLAKNGTLHPLQRAFMAHHGLQCGFCTPGFLMLAAATLERDPGIGDEELLDVLSSNLCRCTGYGNIVKAVRAVRDEMRLAEPAVVEAPKAAIDPAPKAVSAQPSAWGDMLEQAETAGE
jgi:aerobic-type carbon monoxide dehydrogenase small subunit (CoxS/CutS family)